MHTLLDLRGPIPSFIHVSDGKMGDAPRAGYDRAGGRMRSMSWIAAMSIFRRLYALHRAGAFFVTRAKSNMNYHRVYSRAVDKTIGVGADQSVALDGFYTRKDYPQHLRRISFCDPETGKRLVFMTNNFALPCGDHRSALQKALAGRTVFQVDQAEPAHQAFLRHVGERRENANLDGGVRLCAGGYHQEGTGAERLAQYTFLQILSVHSFEKIELSRAFQECRR